MANEDVLGPRKTMFVLVIVVGCFAVLWPRILSPLILGNARDQLKPNQFDREAGCCEVIFASEVAVLELLTEVCKTAVGTSGQLTPLTQAECRRFVNETCGVDIAAFLKRSENVGKTTKMLLDTMKNSNSSCLKENFGVPVWSMSDHIPLNSWVQQSEKIKQERPLIRGAQPHPALREKGRAIPAGAPTPPSRGPVPLPPHIRVRSSPLSVYFDVDIQPPPIPGMRPPLGSPGGPQQAPKSSMGFVMPIYTICIIVFFVYTLSKILFKRAGTVPYDQVTPDPQFRRRVFRDDSRTSPEPKFGHKEKDARDVELEALRARLAETERAMQRIVSQLAQRDANVQDNNLARPYTNGSVPNTDDTPVRIVATEYVEPIREEKEPTPEPKRFAPEPKEPSPEPKVPSLEFKEPTPETEKFITEWKERIPELEETIPVWEKPTVPEQKELTPELREPTPEPKESTPEPKELTPEPKEITPEPTPLTPEPRELTPEPTPVPPEPKELTPEREESVQELQISSDKENHKSSNGDVRRHGNDDDVKQITEDFLEEAREDKKATTPELLEQALKESDEEIEEEEEEIREMIPENSSVKVLGMETRAHAESGGTCPPPPRAPAPPRPSHEADEVTSIYLETDIPQQSKVLVTDFAEDRTDRPALTKHSPLVVSGKMTLSLIQDSPRETPERDPESTFDDFTTASAVTQPAEKKDDDYSDEEEIEEEIEVEEIEEEIEEEEEDEEPAPAQKRTD